MLLDVTLVLLALTLAVAVIGWAWLRIMRRLGLDPNAIFFWFGLTERPLEVPRGRGRRLSEL